MELTLLAGAGAACALGGVLPWISAEAVVLGAALALPPQLLPSLVVGCALGQMVGKGGLYGVMRWAPHRLPDRARRVLDRVEPLARRPGILGASVFTGAATGLPPFYIVTLASGLSGLPLATFGLAGLGGCLVRYGALVWGAEALGWGGAP